MRIYLLLIVKEKKKEKYVFSEKEAGNAPLKRNYLLFNHNVTFQAALISFTHLGSICQRAPCVHRVLLRRLRLGPEEVGLRCGRRTGGCG